MRASLWRSAAAADTKAFLAPSATDPMPGTSDKLGKLMQLELAKWHTPMQIAGLEPQ